MDNEQFVTTVEQAAGIGRERAERAIQATLSTLPERIAQGEARDLAEQLPPEVAPWLSTNDGAHRFDVDQFLRRAAEREDTDVPAAEQHARAVFLAVGRAVSPGELADLAAELPNDYALLLPAGPHVEMMVDFQRGPHIEAGRRQPSERVGSSTNSSRDPPSRPPRRAHGARSAARPLRARPDRRKRFVVADHHRRGDCVPSAHLDSIARPEGGSCKRRPQRTTEARAGSARDGTRSSAKRIRTGPEMARIST